MKVWMIVGGRASPNAIVLAKNWIAARNKYNLILEAYYGKKDLGVGVYELKQNQVALLDGGVTVREFETK